LHPVVPGSAAQAESGSRRMTAEERRKASGPAYRAAAAPAHRGAATVGAPFGAPPPSLGSKDILGSKDFASRPFEASFLEADPDAKRIAAMPFRVVIAGLAVVTRPRSNSIESDHGLES
jgi:hypothetical protein